MKQRTKNTKQNEWIIDGSVAIGVTSSGEMFEIDIVDLNMVKDFCWRIHARGYVVANAKSGTNKIISLHRHILDADDGVIIDHKDRNKLNNKRSNLRIATKSQNNSNINMRSDNTSGFTGVKRAKSGKWVAQITHNKVRLHLGTFDKICDAIDARISAEIKYHGEFRRTLHD